MNNTGAIWYAVITDGDDYRDLTRGSYDLAEAYRIGRAALWNDPGAYIIAVDEDTDTVIDVFDDL